MAVYPPPNPFGPVPLSSLGFIAMQPLVIFQPDENSQLGISADGLSVIYTKAGVQRILNMNGTDRLMPTQTGYNTGIVLGAWNYGDKLQIATTENCPENFVVPYDTDLSVQYLTTFRLYDKNNDLILLQRAIPNSFPSEYGPTASAWFDNPFGSNLGVAGNAIGLKQDDIDTPNGLYWAMGAQYNQPLISNNVLRINCDLSKIPEPIFDVTINDFGNTVECSYKAGLAWDGIYYGNFQAPAYEANFDANVLFVEGEENAGIRTAGLNCSCFWYYDMAIGRVLPPRMAQDQYLWALSRFQNQTSMGGNAVSPNCIPTRLLNSATYAQSLWQPNLAINESMLQYGITSEYPEMQLANVAFFHDDNQVSYYNVLPQDFLQYDISQSPDLLWVSPTGSVLGVYHDNSGNYYFMIGGTRVTYQSAVYNYRYNVGN